MKRFKEGMVPPSQASSQGFKSKALNLPELLFSGFPGGSVVKETTFQCRKCDGFNPWVRKIPWSRKWQPTPVFLPGESHGQRSLVGYSPWSHTESDMTERLSTQHTHTRMVTDGAVSM